MYICVFYSALPAGLRKKILENGGDVKFISHKVRHFGEIDSSTITLTKKIDDALRQPLRVLFSNPRLGSREKSLIYKAIDRDYYNEMANRSVQIGSLPIAYLVVIEGFARYKGFCGKTYKKIRRVLRESYSLDFAEYLSFQVLKRGKKIVADSKRIDGN